MSRPIRCRESGEPLIDKHEMELEAVKDMDAVLPALPDVFMVVGGISAVILVYLVASRLIPIVNIWEQRELLLYKIHKPFHRAEVLVLGKKD